MPPAADQAEPLIVKAHTSPAGSLPVLRNPLREASFSEARARSADAASAAELRKSVKDFVKSAVRGIRVELLQTGGPERAMFLRLSRGMDAFELAPECCAQPQLVNFAEVRAVKTQCRALHESAAPLSHAAIGALSQAEQYCAVVELWDGRGIALCLPGGIGSLPTSTGKNGPGADIHVLARCLGHLAGKLQRKGRLVRRATTGAAKKSRSSSRAAVRRLRGAASRVRAAVTWQPGVPSCQ